EENDTLFDGTLVAGVPVLRTSSAATNIHSHYVGSAVDELSALELTGRMRIEDPDGGFGITLFSDYPVSDHYYRLRRYAGTDFHVAPHGATMDTGETASGVVPEAGVWYAFRVFAEANPTSSRVRAKVWRATDAEPVDWQIDCTDLSANRLTSGAIGAWSMGPGEKYLADLRVNGEAIQLPPLGGPSPQPTDVVEGLWLDTAPDNGLQTDDSLFLVGRVGDELCLSTTSGATNIHSHFSTDQSSSWSDYTVTGRLRVEDVNGGAGITVLSDYPQSDRYYRLRRYGDGPFTLSPHGTSITSGTTDSGVVPTPGVWYDFEVQVVDDGSATVVRAKVWLSGTQEPSDFQIDCLDESATRLTQGTIGLWTMGPGAKKFVDVRMNGQELALPSPTSIVVNVSDTTLVVGESTVLDIDAHYADGGVVDVTGLATLSHGDRLALEFGPPMAITAVEPGTETLIASFDGQSDELDIQSLAAEVQSLQLVGAASLHVGESTGLGVTAVFTDGASEDVTADVEWSVSDDSIVQVQPGSPAVLHGMSAGSATVTVSYDGMSTSTIVTVSEVQGLVGLEIQGPTAP
ncbi:MAG: Ig-like domain-containing protein, partial [Planctomycetes bacterium]|nr:Ig-like domain-containing protein [Planctomycetota bacterium]